MMQVERELKEQEDFKQRKRALKLKRKKEDIQCRITLLTQKYEKEFNRDTRLAVKVDKAARVRDVFRI